MDDTQFAQIAGWIAEAGLAGEEETTLLAGFCERMRGFGLPIARASVIVDTLHPTYEGRLFTWRADRGESQLREYERIREGDPAEQWRRSPFYRLLETGESMICRRLTPETDAEFPILRDLRTEGITGYIAMINRFSAERAIGDMDCVYSSWSTEAPPGFTDGNAGDLARIMPILALAVKSASLGRVAATLVETYLGRDAGRRVLSGRIARGVADRIEAVLWFSDLRGFTAISEAAAPEQIIPFLNDYAEAIISAIHEKGGDVLKLMGDGILAIFTADEPATACRCALDAYAAATARIQALNAKRAGQEEPTSSMYLGLHIGEVYYGNIGSKERLDFTVVGPAVNEVSRIAFMCRSIEQPMLVSPAFAEALGDDRRSLVSVGRYALRGVRRPQELYTLDMTR